MKDIYGLLLVLGFLLIIAQCTSKNVEKFLNDDDSNGIINKVETEVKEDVDKFKKMVGPSEKPSTKGSGQVSGYNPGTILLASSDKESYGFNVPPSMQQDYTTNLSFGKAMVQPPKSFVFFSDEQLQGAPINASMQAFDPSAKGGLPSLIGQKQPSPAMPQRQPTQKQPTPSENLFDVKGQQPSQGKPSSSKSVKVYMVYGDWCGWSKKALGPFKEAMNESGVTTSMGTPVEFTLIEDKSPEFKNFKEMVKGFPTFVLGKFENGSEVSKELLNVKDRTKAGFLSSAKSIQY
jgi:hypothetical protein